jgi:hypothetical protein
MIRVKDGNDYAIMTPALEPLLVLARDTGAHVQFVHHGGKGEKADIDAALGSTAIAGAVDAQLVLKRSDRYRTLSSVQRYGEDLAALTLEMDAITRRISAGPPKEDADAAAAGVAILEYLGGQSEPIEERTIHDNVEGRKGDKVKGLRALVADSKVTRTGDGKRGAPYLYAVSGSLVPTYTREPENQKCEIAGSPRETEPYSGFAENGSGGATGTTIGTTIPEPSAEPSPAPSAVSDEAEV